MLHVLENEWIKTEISVHGAELQSIFHKQIQLEYLWQGDSSYWPRRAPILFPIVGKLKENIFNYQDKTYSLPQHGFARDKKFEVIHKTTSKIIFRLQSTEETLKQYPFHFILDIGYSIFESQVIISYTVQNSENNKDLIFSIGAHPGFLCPLKAHEQFNDYYLEFDKEESLERVLLEGGLRSSAMEAIQISEKILPLHQDLFEVKDAIVLKGMKSDRISLKSKNHGNGLHFNFKGYPWFGIWSKPGPFICLEPWMGVADDVLSNQDFTEKEGIQRLAAGKHVSYSYSIELF